MLEYTKIQQHMEHVMCTHHTKRTRSYDTGLLVLLALLTTVQFFVIYAGTGSLWWPSLASGTTLGACFYLEATDTT